MQKIRKGGTGRREGQGERGHKRGRNREERGTRNQNILVREKQGGQKDKEREKNKKMKNREAKGIRREREREH